MEERCLSPVLNNSKINRQYIQKRRSQRKSSRVKLTDRFQNTSSSSATSSQHNITEGTSSLSENLSQNNEQNESKNTENIGAHDGFRTAAGRTILLPENQIKKYDKLFEDIMDLKSNKAVSRRSKLSFLSKGDSGGTSAGTELQSPSQSVLRERNIETSKTVDVRRDSVGDEVDSGELHKQEILELIEKMGVEEQNELLQKIMVEGNEHNVEKDLDRPVDVEMIGFHLAGSGEGIEVSNLALSRARRYLEDITDNKSESYNPPTQTTTEIDKKRERKVLEKSDSVSDVETTKKISEESVKFEEPASKKMRFSDVDPASRNCFGFRSASGKNIELSAIALESAKKTLGDDFEKVEVSLIALSGSDLEELSFSDFNAQPKKDETESASFKKPSDDNIKISDDLTNAQNSKPFVGFKKASGDNIELSEETLKKAQKILDFVPEIEDISTCQNNTFGFKKASGNNIELSEINLKKAQTLFEKMPEISGNSSNTFSGFKKASGNNIELSEINLKKAQTLFEKMPEISENTPNTFGGFTKASGNKIELSESNLKKAQRIFDNVPEISDQINIKNSQTKEFQGFPESEISETETSYTEFKNTIEEVQNSISGKKPSKRLSNDENIPPITKKIKTDETPKTNKMSVSSSALSKAKDLFADILDLNTFKPMPGFQRPERKQQTTLPTFNEISDRSINKNKKRLGISSNRHSLPSKDHLERAKMIFDNLSPPKPIFNSTPVKSSLAASCSTPQKPGSPVLFNSTITPIKNNDITNTSSLAPGNFIMQEVTKGGVEKWCAIYEEQIADLHKRLGLMEARVSALKEQRLALESNDPKFKRMRLGVLSSKKMITEKRISLKDLAIRTEVGDKYLGITPQNADMIHFPEHGVVLKTEDGGIVIPNIDNLIGLSEIETCFKSMPGVESKLIPKGWIQNHYKMIVWKLASYERFFKDINDCLNVENIIQQLKYRYDREIDRAQRPALRKILEKDDVPQKRMVLCISNINKISENSFEIELSDGWYTIKTVIDEPLNKEILNNRLLIGTKLVIAGAELLNCDGCHPLDVTDLVRLKINYNATRRALWFAKLGFCRNPQPFPVTLRSISPAGGNVGCIKVYIARIYPLKYLEKQGKMRVWRNRKADERRAQEWENSRLKQIEEVERVVRKDYEKSMSKQNLSNIDVNNVDVSTITCPRTLYHLYETCRDPDSFHDSLSVTQRDSIIDYQQNLNTARQQEINTRIKEKLSKLDIYQRDVTSVLKMIVLDATERNDKGFIFQIWKADDNHLEMLKEGSIFSIYNVIPKINGDLNSSVKSKFVMENDDISNFSDYKRIFTPIGDLLNNWNNCLFNEFDTVGIIVQLSINSFDQSLWLSDSNGSLVYVKIFEGPKNCFLLDSLNVGDIISACNLIVNESKSGFAQAIANHSTVISKYPEHKHLQEAIKIIRDNLSNMEEFLEKCQEQISFYLDKTDVTKSSRNSSIAPSVLESNLIDSNDVFDETFEENTLVYSRITSIDVAMSMIDIDKFV